MHMLLECKVLGDGQRHLRSDKTLHDRIVCQVQEHCNMIRNTAFLEGVAEEISYVVLDAHGGEHDGELFV